MWEEDKPDPKEDYKRFMGKRVIIGEKKDNKVYWHLVRLLCYNHVLGYFVVKTGNNTFKQIYTHDLKGLILSKIDGGYDVHDDIKINGIIYLDDGFDKEGENIDL